MTCYRCNAPLAMCRDSGDMTCTQCSHDDAEYGLMQATDEAHAELAAMLDQLNKTEPFWCDNDYPF